MQFVKNNKGDDMNENIDLSKYQIRTDLAVDEIDKKDKLKGVKYSEEIIDNIKVTNVILSK